MLDREKVIKAIELCYTLGHNCTECPLFSEDDCNDKLMHDVLSLLKEQEPVKPIERNGFYYCGACRYALMTNHQKYCSDCGKKVKWE